jgi:hypothetical protein
MTHRCGKILRKRCAVILCPVMCSLFVGSTSSAAVAFRAAHELTAGTTLAEILDVNGPYNGLFHVFDKEFNVTSFSGANAGDIVVNPVIFSNPLDGIGFDLVFMLGSGDSDDSDNESGSPDGGVLKQLIFNYTVTITDPSFVITDALLATSGSALTGGSDFDGDNGDAFIQIFETYSGTGLSNTLMIQDDFAGGTVTDQQFFSGNPQTSIDVNKVIDIFANGGEEMDGDSDDDASASLDFIRQTFSQTLIPTPGVVTVLLLAPAMIGRRRR